MQRMRHLFPIFLFLLVVVQAAGQTAAVPKVGRKTSRDPQLLAQKLTEGLTNDSDKVKSIFNWIAGNIKYDVRGMSGGSYERPQDILRHRKAVCLGMSILFDTLCKEAGIDAAVVLGYVYMPWYEARDTFYLDTHAWNAVKIDGEWQLLDVTWSKGYLKLRRQPLRRFFLGLFHIAPKQRYRYVNKITYRYYRTAPEIFVLDHLPSTPAWQLLDCYVPIDSFQRSPQSTQNYLDNPVFCRNAGDSIESIMNAQEYRRMLVSGRQAVAFNRHNHQDISYGGWLYAGHFMQLAYDTSLSLETRMLYCDSAAMAYDKTARYFKSTARDSRDERDFFLRRNRRMKAQVDAESKPLLRRHYKEIGQVRRERLMARTQVSKLRNENRRLRRESRSIRKKNIEVKRPEKPSEQQENMSEKLAGKFDSNREKLDSLKQELDSVSYYHFSYEGLQYDTFSAERKRMLTIMYHDMRAVMFFRSLGQTCYDTLVFSPKNEFLLVQKQHDSLRRLTRPPGKWVTDSAAKATRKTASVSKMLLRQNMAICRQLAKLPAGSLDEKQSFRQAQDEFVALNDSMIAANKLHMRDLRRYNRSLKRMRVLHWRVRWLLRQEIRDEMLRYSGTGRFFRDYYRGMFLMFRHDADNATKLRREAKKHKQELLRELRRKQREEVKRKKKEAALQKKKEAQNRN